MHPAKSDRAGGLTLIEVVVAMALLVVLATLAVPAYRGQQLRSRRVEATNALLALAVEQERAHARHGHYLSDLTSAPPAGLGLPETTANGHYRITLRTADGGAGFLAVATAAGAQADDGRCARFTIDEAGRRTATSAECLSP